MVTTFNSAWFGAAWISALGVRNKPDLSARVIQVMNRVMEPLPRTGCATCGEYARFERLAPRGDIFACPDCGRKFRRVRSNTSADKVLDVLLISGQLKTGLRR